MIVSHPFADSAIIMGKKGESYKILNLLEDKEDLLFWQNTIIKRIEPIVSAKTIIMMITKSYRLAFFKYSLPYLSLENMSAILGEVWCSIEQGNFNQDMSQEELLELFQVSDPNHLMKEQELEAFGNLPEEINVYRGVQFQHDENIRSISWTTDPAVANWFAQRFSHNGVVYQAKIDKQYVYAYFLRAEESEPVLDPSKLKELSVLPNIDASHG